MPEKQYSLQVAKVLGVSDTSRWSQVYFSSPEEKEKKNKRGSLLAVFSIEAPQDNFRPDYGKELVSRLQEEYYEQLSGWPMQQLVKALKNIAEELENNSLSFKVGITAAVFWQGIWYFAVLGGGRVLVRRGPTVSAVLVGEGEEVASSSGQAENGDLIMLGTEDFFSLSESVIQEALGEDNLQEAAEGLSPALVERENNGASAGLLVKLKMKDSQKAGTKQEPSIMRQKTKRAIGKFSLPENIPWKVIGLVLIALGLLSGAVFGVMRWRRSRQSQVAESLTAVESLYQEALPLTSSDEVEAKRLLEEAKTDLTAIKSNYRHQEQQDWQNKIESELAKIAAPAEEQINQEELAIFLDLAQSESEQVDDLAVLGEEIYWLDKASQTIYQTGWSAEDNTVLIGDERLQNAMGFFAATGQMTILSSDGIYETEDKKLAKIIEADEQWGEISDLATWFGNIYLLDSGKDKVWQYPSVEDGYGELTTWNEEDLADISSGASLAINGAIWVTGQDEVYRLWRGYVDETFSVEGLNSEALIFTTADFDNLYLVDKKNWRILAVSKEDGQLVFEKKAANLNKATGLVVSSDETTALVATPEKIYKLNVAEEASSSSGDAETTPKADAAE